MIVFIIFALFMLTAAITAIIAVGAGLFALVGIGKKSFKIAFTLTLALLIASLLLVSYSQITVSTPAIESTNSVAELKKVELNGRKEWITVRGRDLDNPVLLFLAGGPGGTQMAASRFELAELEKHFIVVSWDQPGSGKSFFAVNNKKLTLEDYIQDGLALTDYLRETYHKEKIYLVGESWGSVLGTFMAERRPDAYFALVGVAQMVDFLETEIIDYNLALEIAIAEGDTKKVKDLQRIGLPPYGKNHTVKSAEYLMYLTAQMSSNPAITNAGYNTFRDIFSQEYGIKDYIGFVMGVTNTYNNFYPKLYGVDLRTDCVRLEVPVYIFIGRHDLNAPTSLAEEYYEVLEAPYKQLVWFEHSGHSPWINESEKFVNELVKLLDSEGGDL